MQLKRAAEENAALLGGQKLCKRAVSVAGRLGISSSSFLQIMRHYIAQAADQDTADLDDGTLRNLMARFPTLQCCPPCQKSSLASYAQGTAIGNVQGVRQPEMLRGLNR